MKYQEDIITIVAHTTIFLEHIHDFVEINKIIIQQQINESKYCWGISCFRVFIPGSIDKVIYNVNTMWEITIIYSYTWGITLEIDK